ncbi:YicC/YloC family endoribonuclease [Desulfovulcanus sp.]
MVKSMTGFGQAQMQTEKWAIFWEIKSVNSRFLDLKWKTPHSLNALQSDWEKIVREYALRGRVELYLNLQILDPSLLGLNFDRTTAVAMLAQLADFAEETSAEFCPDLNRFLNLSSLWRDKGGEIDPVLKEDLRKTLENALIDWDQSKFKEGVALAEDLKTLLNKLSNLVYKLEELAADNAGKRYADLKERVDKLLQEYSVQVDESRMLQELAFLADRLDVSEELTRLKSHLKSMQDLIDKPGEIGRKLDFMLQETFREINTCSNKCHNIEMNHIAVEFKAELEKCREQAQNLE